MFLLLGKCRKFTQMEFISELQNRSDFLIWGRLDFFFYWEFHREVGTQSQLKLVLTYVISQQEVNHCPFRKAYPQHSPCLLPEQEFGILAARIYFSSQRHQLWVTWLMLRLFHFPEAQSYGHLTFQKQSEAASHSLCHGQLVA